MEGEIETGVNGILVNVTSFFIPSNLIFNCRSNNLFLLTVEKITMHKNYYLFMSTLRSSPNCSPCFSRSVFFSDALRWDLVWKVPWFLPAVWIFVLGSSSPTELPGSVILFRLCGAKRGGFGPARNRQWEFEPIQCLSMFPRSSFFHPWKRMVDWNINTVMLLWQIWSRGARKKNPSDRSSPNYQTMIEFSADLILEHGFIDSGCLFSGNNIFSGCFHYN